MKKITLITLIINLLISCSKESQTITTPTQENKSYTKLFLKGTDWEFVRGKAVKSKDTTQISSFFPVGNDQALIGARVNFTRDFVPNTRLNGNNTGPNACIDTGTNLSFPIYKDSSSFNITNRYIGTGTSSGCSMFGNNRLHIISFTDSTMILFIAYNTSLKPNEYPEDVLMYHLKIRR